MVSRRTPTRYLPVPGLAAPWKATPRAPDGEGKPRPKESARRPKIVGATQTIGAQKALPKVGWQNRIRFRCLLKTQASSEWRGSRRE